MPKVVLNPLEISSKIVQGGRLENETLQIIGFEGFFNLNRF